MLHEHSENVEYHFKSGGIIKDEKSFYALKANAFSAKNSKEYGLPSIIGAILLFSGDMAYPLAIMDSVAITARRTGATGALAAKYLSRKDSETVLICGAGTQGCYQLEALMEVRPIKKAYVWSRSSTKSQEFVEKNACRLGLEIIVVETPSEVSKSVDIIITATPSKNPLIKKEDVSAGTFIAAIGADSAHKQEIDPCLLASSKVVTDITDQCLNVGELHHAIDGGYMTADEIYGSIGEIVVKKKAGRENQDEIIIFDSTGTAIQDSACAVTCYMKALESGLGTVLKLN
jgi:ornithine cyclodeaminase/alanine dehydrogenase